jgi:hypothetical protein
MVLDAASFPSGVTEEGDTEQLAAAGTPLQLNATGWANPLLGVTVSVNVTDCPALIFAEAEENETEKSGLGPGDGVGVGGGIGVGGGGIGVGDGGGIVPK